MTTGRYRSVAFIWMDTPQDFTHRLVSYNHLLQPKKEHLKKVLLSSFHLNGYTVESHPQTESLEPPRTVQ